ncbi:MAG: hypothetical protein EZS28_019019 [Streblomastix strix]|uniref:Uncharacterized protein n=1 Tax=Streblomastix strix TaxID=222440 RepID=A0A5J4VSB7_9EUKA|nr:MAG: hypothetical protein EZS28_019019 [Streblomastix strix]
MDELSLRPRSREACTSSLKSLFSLIPSDLNNNQGNSSKTDKQSQSSSQPRVYATLQKLSLLLTTDPSLFTSTELTDITQFLSTKCWNEAIQQKWEEQDWLQLTLLLGQLGQQPIVAHLTSESTLSCVICLYLHMSKYPSNSIFGLNLLKIAITSWGSQLNDINHPLIDMFIEEIIRIILRCSSPIQQPQFLLGVQSSQSQQLDAGNTGQQKLNQSTIVQIGNNSSHSLRQAYLIRKRMKQGQRIMKLNKGVQFYDYDQEYEDEDKQSQQLSGEEQAINFLATEASNQTIKVVSGGEITSVAQVGASLDLFQSLLQVAPSHVAQLFGIIFQHLLKRLAQPAHIGQANLIQQRKLALELIFNMSLI